jgi:hypothetical protein
MCVGEAVPEPESELHSICARHESSIEEAAPGRGAEGRARGAIPKGDLPEEVSACGEGSGVSRGVRVAAYAAALAALLTETDHRGGGFTGAGAGERRKGSRGRDDDDDREERSEASIAAILEFTMLSDSHRSVAAASIRPGSEMELKPTSCMQMVFEAADRAAKSKANRRTVAALACHKDRCTSLQGEPKVLCAQAGAVHGMQDH